jgi:hypothetical protein
MFEIPVVDSLLRVGGFQSSKEGVIVQFTDLPQQCTLPRNGEDFARSVAAIAESWRTGTRVRVSMRGAGDIVSVQVAP